jgi:hypothetical protein
MIAVLTLSSLPFLTLTAQVSAQTSIGEYEPIVVGSLDRVWAVRSFDGIGTSVFGPFFDAVNGTMTGNSWWAWSPDNNPDFVRGTDPSLVGVEYRSSAGVQQSVFCAIIDGTDQISHTQITNNMHRNDTVIPYPAFFPKCAFSQGTAFNVWGTDTPGHQIYLPAVQYPVGDSRRAASRLKELYWNGSAFSPGDYGALPAGGGTYPPGWHITVPDPQMLLGRSGAIYDPFRPLVVVSRYTPAPLRIGPAVHIDYLEWNGAYWQWKMIPTPSNVWDLRAPVIVKYDRLVYPLIVKIGTIPRLVLRSRYRIFVVGLVRPSPFIIGGPTKPEWHLFSIEQDVAANNAWASDAGIANAWNDHGVAPGVTGSSSDNNGAPGTPNGFNMTGWVAAPGSGARQVDLFGQTDNQDVIPHLFFSRNQNQWLWDTDPNAYQVPAWSFGTGTRPRTCSAYNQLGRLGVVVRLSNGQVWDHFLTNGVWDWTQITP